jgi:hypothetical protein
MKALWPCMGLAIYVSRETAILLCTPTLGIGLAGSSVLASIVCLFFIAHSIQKSK